MYTIFFTYTKNVLIGGLIKLNEFDYIYLILQ